MPRQGSLSEDRQEHPYEARRASLPTSGTDKSQNHAARSRAGSIARQPLVDTQTLPSASGRPIKEQSFSPPEEHHGRKRQPLSAAVNDAFDKSEVASSIDPDLVAAITAQVIQNLKLNGVNSGLQSPSKQPAGSQPTPEFSPTRSIPPRDVYTPPSPVRDEASNIGSLASSVFEDIDPGMLDSIKLDRSAPEQVDTHFAAERPRPQLGRAIRQSSGNSTTLEKIWQPLFSQDGKPTARLGHFLRGLALHIIEDYEPVNSLVITPPKMLKFYDQVKLSNEIYPWPDMFGGKMTNSSISHLYRDLGCQHHFVQASFDDKPTIPSLTPLGFECWMTHLIRAYPDIEFERLAKAVLEMPISNAENRRERFPKQLSRRLFPAKASAKAREYLEDCVLADPEISLKRSVTPIQEDSPPQVAPKSHMQASELEHQPIPKDQEGRSPTPPPPPSVESVAESVVESPPVVAIERERKPYHAQPGCGRVLNDIAKPESHQHRSHTISSTRRPTVEFSDDVEPRLSRYRSENIETGASHRRRLSPSKLDKVSRGPVTDMQTRQTRSNAYESDDDANRLSRQQSKEQRARQYVMESTAGHEKGDVGRRPRRGSVQAPPPPSAARHA